MAVQTGARFRKAQLRRAPHLYAADARASPSEELVGFGHTVAEKQKRRSACYRRDCGKLGENARVEEERLSCSLL
jgi:hypothetical protein